MQASLDEQVVLARRDQVKIYPNQHGGITIEQAMWPDAEGSVIGLESVADARILIAALLAMCDHLDAGSDA